MMHRKALLFGDIEQAARIMRSNDPRSAKHLGRGVQGFEKSAWSKRARQIVEAGCLLKFAQCPEAQRVLLATGDRQLVEASPHDQIWGIGLSTSSAQAVAPSEWPGLNWLGHVLVRVREQLREAAATVASSKEGAAADGAVAAGTRKRKPR